MVNNHLLKESWAAIPSPERRARLGRIIRAGRFFANRWLIARKESFGLAFDNRLPFEIAVLVEECGVRRCPCGFCFGICFRLDEVPKEDSTKSASIVGFLDLTGEGVPAESNLIIRFDRGNNTLLTDLEISRFAGLKASSIQIVEGTRPVHSRMVAIVTVVKVNDHSRVLDSFK
jgi:hypothetical protein